MSIHVYVGVCFRAGLDYKCGYSEECRVNSRTKWNMNARLRCPDQIIKGEKDENTSVARMMINRGNSHLLSLNRHVRSIFDLSSLLMHPP